MQFLFLNRNNILLKITHGHIFFWIKVLAKNVSNGFNIRLPFQAASTQFSTTNLLTFIFFKCMTLELIHLIQDTHNGVTRTSYGSKVIDFTSAHAISTSVIFSLVSFSFNTMFPQSTPVTRLISKDVEFSRTSFYIIQSLTRDDHLPKRPRKSSKVDFPKELMRVGCHLK